ncbi:alpha-tocopherol transfer protein-like [Culicoides brevitarsis]|uniref:alpha-tocopherol transfer protein-like n=1 Tax=Culicoides brevitarsis TaxID=469753 RepID=UPI00307C2880
MASIRPLSTNLKLKAMSELNETSDRIQSDLVVLKDWLQKCGYINARTDDQFLIGFLRGSKFSIERTKEKLDNYYSSRFVAPEIYPKDKYCNPKILEVLKQGISIPLPETEHPVAPRVVIIRAGHYNPETTHITEIFQMAVMMYAIMLLEDDNFVVSGLVNIIDLKGLKASQMAQFTPKLIEKLIFVTQDALPVRQRAFHFLNLPPGLGTMLNMFKNLMNARNRHRFKESSLQIEVHGSNLEKLYKFVPKSILPKEYGGEAPCIDELMNVWEEKFKSYENYFKEDEQYGTDESKRPEGARQKTNEDAMMIGTFRQLSVD